MRFLVLLIFVWVLSGSGLGQDQGDGSQAGPADVAAQDGEAVEGTAEDGGAGGAAGEREIPPQLLLGLRSRELQRRVPVLREVVVVPDGASFIAAIEAWSSGGRAPVLIDDGTWGARDNIARFVRAYEPARVVRWRLADGARDDAPLRDRVDRAVAAAWDVTPEELAALQRSRSLLLVSGVVVTSDTDSAWPAALALAAGRSQFIVWDRAPTDASGVFQLAQVDALSTRLEAACAATGMPWDGLGDVLDSVTLCLNCPGKVKVPPEDKRGFLATTDLIGRHVDETAARARRWAWSGQIFGSEAESAYRAMCSLFMEPRDAWLFDGYPTSEPWNMFDMTAAAAELVKGKFEITLDDAVDRGRSSTDWRLRVSNASPGELQPGIGLSRQLIMVNTKGLRTEFNLSPGQCLAGDVPFLRRPAAVHFVHSWSANRQSDRAIVAGRWMERGVYAYAGSVHEPYLFAFEPTPRFVGRLLAGLPWGVAARHDDAEVWKIAVIGDPLMMLGVPPPSVDGSLALEGSESVDVHMKAALGDRRVGEAVTDLVLLARDRDVVRLVKALDRQDPGAVTPEIALTAMMSAAFEGDRELFVRLGLVLADADALPGPIRDAVWHTLWPTLGTLVDREIDLLRRSMRSDQIVRDIVEVGRSLRITQDERAGEAFVESQRVLLSEKDQAALRKALANE